jgi:hypothetical protein
MCRLPRILCHRKISHHPDLRLRTASPSHTIGDNSDSAPLPPPASILVLLLSHSLCAANPASNCLKRTYVERHSLMPPQFSVTTDRLAKTFSNVLLNWTSVPRVILSYRSVSSHASSVPKGSLITATIRMPSVCHQCAIRGPSEGHQCAIRRSSEGHQRAIRRSSVRPQWRISMQSKAPHLGIRREEQRRDEHIRSEIHHGVEAVKPQVESKEALEERAVVVHDSHPQAREVRGGRQ